MFHRLFSIPLDQTNFNSELCIIKQISTVNEYPSHIINKLFFQHLIKHLNTQLLTTPTDCIYRFHTFINPISINLKKFFSKYNINICFKTDNNLYKHLVNVKDKIPVLKKSGVYCLICGDPSCQVTYVGQSGRRIETRVNDHFKLINRYKSSDINNTPSAFAN